MKLALGSHSTPEQKKIMWWNKQCTICRTGQTSYLNPLGYGVFHIISNIPEGQEEEYLRHALSYKDTQVNRQDTGTLMTPLHWACVHTLEHHNSLIAILLDVQGIKINIQNINGNSPLFFACTHNNSPSDKRVDLLLATGNVNFSLRNKQGKNIVEHAYDGYVHWEKTCIKPNNWPLQEQERIICAREVALHKIILAAAQPIQCALIKAVFYDEETQEDMRIALLPEIIVLIMQRFYLLNSERIAAYTYKPEKCEKNVAHSYYSLCCADRMEMKTKMMQSPTKEILCLLWG